MSGYKVTFARSARKELQTLSIDVAKRVLEKIETLEVNARPTGSKKLSGAKDLWRLRVGDYRVVYKIDDKDRIVDIAIIRHRKDVYR
ncbi:MAG: type II toxin-antitoxin system RelE/ParE family toxin [Desulfobacterales bacterium]